MGRDVIVVIAFLRAYRKPLIGASVVLAIVAAVLMYGSHRYDQGVRRGPDVASFIH